MKFLPRIASKFGNAFQGLRFAFTSDNSFKTHIVASLLVIAIGWLLSLSLLEWVLLIFAIGLVFVSELFNTAIEFLVRMFTQEYHELAEKLLDISAGAVLFAAMTSVIIAILVIGPRLWNLVFGK